VNQLRKVSLVAAMVLALLLNCVSVYASTTVKPAPPSNVSQAKPDEKAAPPKPADTKAVPAEQQQVAPEHVIKFGDRGDEVKKVQKLLADIGFYAGEMDGIFGPGTLAAVKEFQSSNGIAVDGTVGKSSIAFLERSNSEPSRYNRVITMTATAFTRFDDGCGDYTYRGHFLRKGLVAVDPSVIPLGTRLYIPGYGYAIADDIGSAIKGNKIDLAFESLPSAYEFGRQRVTVYILD
jgi:3D (Asp-Asp-Asp) domain-containing protein